MYMAVNQKYKVFINNPEEDRRELMSSPKKKSNLYKLSIIYFQSLAYFLITFSVFAPLAILVDRY